MNILGKMLVENRDDLDRHATQTVVVIRSDQKDDPA